MALTLREKTEREVGKLKASLEKLGPKFEKADKALAAREAVFAKQQAAMQKAKDKHGVLAAKKAEIENYIAAYQAAIDQSAGPSVDVPAELDELAGAAVAEAEAASVEDDIEEEDLGSTEDDDIEPEIL